MSERRQPVRRIGIGSDREIEYVATPGPSLHLCADCGRDLVYPVEWEETPARRWRVLLRCPNCEWTGLGTFDQATVDRLDEQLDLGTAAMSRDLERLERANLEDEIERFTAALRLDAILPEDF